MPTPGRDTQAWRAICRQVKAEEHTCVRCGKGIDWTLPRTSKWSGTVDHYPVALALLTPGDPRIEDRGNARAAHRSCNSAAGARPVIPSHSRQW